MTSAVIAASGDPHHRGIDLIAVDGSPTQTLTGAISYGLLDKALEDEDVELFGCLDDHWLSLGSTRTDGDGRFALALADDERLPIGMRDLYASVVGDRTGAAFIGYVAAADTRLVVSDVDGTLTEDENAFPEALVNGETVAAQPGAAGALAAVAAKGYRIVYVTARGDRFTQDTRDWFAAQGFPRGPMRMPAAIVTAPGADTIEFKTSALASLSGFDVVVGIGNRDSDITAYTAAGIAPEHIFIKLAEFADEVAVDLDAGKATGFYEYDVLRATLQDTLP